MNKKLERQPVLYLLPSLNMVWQKTFSLSRRSKGYGCLYKRTEYIIQGWIDAT